MNKTLEDYDEADHLLMESLSAVLDNQSSEPELRRVLSRFESTKESDIREKAQRYLMIGDVIRHRQDKFSCVDISANVRRALQNEVLQETSAPVNKIIGRKNTLSAFFKSLANKWEEHWVVATGHIAVAASVAAVVVFSGNYYHQTSKVNDAWELSSGYVRSMPDQSSTLSQPVQMQSASYGASGILAGYGVSSDNPISPEQAAYVRAVADETTRERFKAYAFQHAGFSAMNGGQALLPFARLTSAGLQ